MTTPTPTPPEEKTPPADTEAHRRYEWPQPTTPAEPPTYLLPVYLLPTGAEYR